MELHSEHLLRLLRSTPCAVSPRRRGLLRSAFSGPSGSGDGQRPFPPASPDGSRLFVDRVAKGGHVDGCGVDGGDSDGGPQRGGYRLERGLGVVGGALARLRVDAGDGAGAILIAAALLVALVG